MKSIAALSILILALQITHVQRFHTKHAVDDQNSLIFLNLVDHFNHLNKNVYAQRYWDYTDSWTNKDYVILYINGEWVGSLDQDFTFQLAKQIGARMFALEHRFYGSSQPMPDWSVPNLKTLTHEQGLADIAYFIEKQNAIMGSPKKWVLVGGSYAGALVGWFRYKYPHLCVGAVASSAVVNVIYDFYMYFEQVKTDLSKVNTLSCYNVIKELEQYVVNIITQGTAKEKSDLKAKLNASILGDKSFLDYFTDAYVGFVQYSQRIPMCTKMSALSKLSSMDEKLAGYAAIGKQDGVNPEDYLFQKESSKTIDNLSSSRQWMYQVCTSFGYFQTGKDDNPITYAGINVDYFNDVCEKIFGQKLTPDVAHTNIMMGGVSIKQKASHIIFFNGGDDPWQWCGLREDQFISGSILEVYLIKCDDCGHCIDLYKPTANDPKELQIARNKTQTIVGMWLNS